MPLAAAGNVISDSAQVNPGVIQGTDIAADAIDTTKIAANAVESGDIKDGEIVNNDINAAAAIVDTKLAQITTAGKVSGAALTSLASIPAGAGKIPAANLGGAINRIAPTSVISTDVATTIATIAVGAGDLGTGNCIYFKIPVWKVKKATNASNAYIDVFYDNDRVAYVDVTNNATTFTDFGGFIEGWLWADGATNAQRGQIHSWFCDDNTSSTTVVALSADGTDTGAKDSTQAYNFYVKWRNGASSVNDYIYTGPGFWYLISA